MIEFEHVLPSMNIDGKKNGQYNNPEMVLPCALTTTDFKLGEFLHLLHNTVADERRLLFLDGRVIACCHNWIRDHVHMMKAFRHWEYDMKSFLQYIIDTQTDEGYFFELIKQLDDVHWSFVGEDCRKLFPDDGVALVRLELEADVEYLVVEGVWQYYRTTGDFEWVKSVLPRLEKAINYMTSSPKRWSGKYGLVIRPFTIDTWDFTNDPASQTDRRIHENEPMCAMHGDNSGVYEAMNILAFFNDKLGEHKKSAEWHLRAETLKANMFRYLWNGKFFIHQFHIDHDGIDDKENVRLSLSNGYDINRGVTDLSQSRSIIEEYMERRKTTTAFAEWFSIDPPYENFKGIKPGKYVNGSISPFTAGEIALAAFRNGYEAYGWDIISRFIKIAEEDGRVCFLYSPLDRGAQNGSGPSGWGSAALLNAVDEGLAGVVDRDCLYKEIDFSPRFAVTDYTELRYITGYELTHKFVDVRYVIKDKGLRYDVISEAEKINAHILLPDGKHAETVLVNGTERVFDVSTVGESEYVDLSVGGSSRVSFEIIFR
ncbi:MAG: hypothetical protein IKP68_01100 [Clostridia bacterium]|nr:hypothetical protein [Clostridia bacterium]